MTPSHDAQTRVPPSRMPARPDGCPVFYRRIVLLQEARAAAR